MKIKFFIAGLFLISQISFAQDFQKILENELSDENPGILFSIKSGDGEINWSGAAGLGSTGDETLLKAENTFRIASVTKTYVAAGILRLMEQGKLSLDDPISNHISKEHQAILSEDYDIENITIRQTLRHSAGFFDHTNAPDFFSRILETPEHEWTRTEQFQLGVDQGEPIGPPGEQFRYSDTGYLILGEIIERYTEKDLDGGLKELLKLESLGLERTDFERKDNKTDELRIHQYFQGIDTYGFSPTIDYYGGGGFLSSTEELALFFEALFTNKVFADPKTLEIMLEPVIYEKRARMDYQMGMYRIKINDMLAYTHTGFWGTQVLYIPELDLYMSANYSSIWKGSAVAPIFSKVLDEL